jgi:hypothetical protein
VLVLGVGVPVDGVVGLLVDPEPCARATHASSRVFALSTAPFTRSP